MSLTDIKSKLIESIKKEYYTPENKEFIEHEVLEPMIKQILDQMYPYFMWMGFFFTSMFLFVVIILLLNLRILFYA